MTVPHGTPDLSALIAQLEQATEGSTILDAAIFTAIGLTAEQEDHCRWWCGMDGRTDLTRERYIDAWAKAFTTSLDAALTLVTEPHWLQHLGQNLSGWNCRVERQGISVASTGRKTPALAICIAGLKARMET